MATDNHRSHISDAELGKQLLKKQLADLNKNPVEGFSAGLINDSDFFKWEVRVLVKYMGNFKEKAWRPLNFALMINMLIYF